MQPGAECGERGGQDGDASDHRMVSGDKSVSLFYDSHHSTTGYVCTEMTRLAATVMEVRLPLGIVGLLVAMVFLRSLLLFLGAPRMLRAVLRLT